MTISARKMLWDAVEKGDLEGARCAVQRGATLDEIIWFEDRNVTPLGMAALKGDVPMLELLLELGADIHQKGPCDETVLYFCVSTGQTQTLKSAIAADGGFDLLRHSALLCAVGKHAECARLLLEMGADPNLPGPIGLPPLHLAVAGTNFESVCALLEGGAHVNATCSSNVGSRAAIQLIGQSIQPVSVRIARRLIEAGAEDAPEHLTWITTSLSACAAGDDATLARALRFHSHAHLSEEMWRNNVWATFGDEIRQRIEACDPAHLDAFAALGAEAPDLVAARKMREQVHGAQTSERALCRARRVLPPI